MKSPLNDLHKGNQLFESAGYTGKFDPSILSTRKDGIGEHEILGMPSVPS